MEFDYQPSLEVVRLIGQIDEFKGSWQSLENLTPERLAALKQVATIESIGSSTRIEGALLSDEEVERFLTGVGKKPFQSRDEEEVAGYGDLIETIYDNWKNIPFTENHIKQLHGTLLKHSQKDDRHRGHYKTAPNHVEATEPSGKKWIVFETASPFDTPFLMTELVAWTNEQIEEGKIHPLLIVATFVVKFLGIHPFQDGNGRLSRALTTLMLLKKGYSYVPYSSMESVIEKNKNAYYLALRKTQTSVKGDKVDWEPWMSFFLQSMQKQKDHLQAKIKRERLLQTDLPAMSIQILELLRQHGSLKAPQMVQALEASPSTLRLRLKELEESERIGRHGKGRGTWYTLKNPEEKKFWSGDDSKPFWSQ